MTVVQRTRGGAQLRGVYGQGCASSRDEEEKWKQMGSNPSNPMCFMLSDSRMETVLHRLRQLALRWLTRLIPTGCRL